MSIYFDRLWNPENIFKMVSFPEITIYYEKILQFKLCIEQILTFLQQLVQLVHYLQLFKNITHN